MIRERERSAVSGWLMLPVLLGLAAAALRSLFLALQAQSIVWVLASVLAEVATVVGLGGFFVVNPNEGRVLQLFGAYRGTVRTAGLRWASPFFTKKAVSLRVRNFENYVKVQTESAIRNLASRYPYDSHDDEKVSLRGSTASVAGDLKHEIQDRLARAGVEVIEARISHLAYAPEIAAVMLRRQQASAIIAARSRIVEGAVGMVDLALERLAKSSHVQLDEERKAAMVSNLLVVLCSDREAQPVVNTGTLYQ